MSTQYQSKSYRKSNYQRIVGQPSPQELKTFFGFILADVTPPKNLYHPILVHYDAKQNKCIASLDKITQSNPATFGQRTVFTSVEFQLALENGYQVNWVYCIHKYKKKKSLWADMIRTLASLKISNSGIPAGYTEKRLRDEYLELGITLAPKIENRKARKAIAKRILNSIWGKNCENKYQDITKILNTNKEFEKIFDFEVQDQKGKIHLLDVQTISDKVTVVKYHHDHKYKDPDLVSSYVPASVFVPAYGRIMLWKAMHKLGKRVLMHDTDSIIYHHIPSEENKEPLTGSLLGDWELDGIHTNENGIIFEFLGLGPKSYGLAYTIPDGTVKHSIKMKGISLKLSTRQKFGYETMRKLCLREITSVSVGQTRFGWNPFILYGTMRTVDFPKIISENNALKGEFNEDENRIYPFGYSSDDEEEDGDSLNLVE